MKRTERDTEAEYPAMQAMFFASKTTEAEPAKPVRAGETWAGPLRLFLFGALVLLLALAFAPGEAQAHGAHAVAKELVTSDVETVEAKSEPSPSDCATCCASAGCLAVAIGMDPALPDFDVPRGAYAMSSIDLLYQSARQGVRRPPKLII